jgi:hypothetical protein
MSWKYYLVMVIPSQARHPPDMSNSNVSKDDRLSPRRFPVPVAVAGVALLALSLLLSIGPAMGVANNSHGGGKGTSGNLKVHDVGTGTETNGTDNEPHVCAFWLGFTFDAPFEAGTWVLVSWAPTGDGSTIASGVYDTSGDGTDSSSVIDVPAGHYRVEWAAAGASGSKTKTFWVDAECGESESQAEEPASAAEESQAEESQAEEPASPAEESQAEESQAEEPVSFAEESTSEEEPTDPADESVADESTVEEPSSAGQEPAGDESVAEDPGTPPGESAETPGDGATDEDGVVAQDPGLTNPGPPPAQEVLGGAASDDPTMSDTAMSTTPGSSGLVATMGLLLLIVAHGTARRSRSEDRDLTDGGV